jgi:organic radical activating enzyme
MEKRYPISEIFLSLQGEGNEIGRPTVFVRFAGCNLNCKFCDTYHIVKNQLTVQEICDQIRLTAGHVKSMTFTGGEPCMHMSAIEEISTQLFEFDHSIETNGSYAISFERAYHVTLSPKTKRKTIKLGWATTLKLLFPYLPGCSPAEYSDFPYLKYRYIQPIDGVDGKPNQKAAIEELYRLGGKWRLSPQLHKLINIP